MKKIHSLCIFICFFGICHLNAIVREEYVEYLKTPFDTEVELYAQAPSKDHFPLIIFLHGSSYENGIRGFPRKLFDHWLNKGYAVAAISLPGYGLSSGNKDLCGPSTIKTLEVAIDHIQNKLKVSKFGLVGFGQGALASLLLAAKRSDVQCVVAGNAVYNLEMFKGKTLFKILKDKDYDFDQTSEKQINERSAMKHIDSIKAPVYILHRSGIKMIINDQDAIDFRAEMNSKGNECKIKLFTCRPGEDQRLTLKEAHIETEEWIESYLDK